MKVRLSKNDVSVLVVEDNQPIRRLMQRLLEREGYSVVLTATGEEALEVITCDRSIIVAVLDMNLPDLHGFDLLRRLRKNAKTAKIPAVMVSASPEAFGDQAILAGAQAFHSKPILPDDLLEIIEQYTSSDG